VVLKKGGIIDGGLDAENEGGGEEIIPWAWGVNGFFSVIGSSATVLIAMRWGFKSVVFIALALYLLSAFMFTYLKNEEK